MHNADLSVVQSCSTAAFDQLPGHRSLAGQDATLSGSCGSFANLSGCTNLLSMLLDLLVRAVSSNELSRLKRTQCVGFLRECGRRKALDTDAQSLNRYPIDRGNCERPVLNLSLCLKSLWSTSSTLRRRLQLGRPSLNALRLYGQYPVCPRHGRSSHNASWFAMSSFVPSSTRSCSSQPGRLALREADGCQ